MGLAQLAADLAAVLKASRGVASHHAALRARQVDAVYARATQGVAAAEGRSRVRRDAATLQKTGDVAVALAKALDEEVGHGASRFREAATKEATLEPRRKNAPKEDVNGSAAESQRSESSSRSHISSKPDSGDAIPSGINLNLFHSRRAEKLLGPLKDQVRQTRELPRRDTDGGIPTRNVKIVWRDVVPEKSSTLAPTSQAQAQAQEIPPPATQVKPPPSVLSSTAQTSLTPTRSQSDTAMRSPSDLPPLTISVSGTTQGNFQGIPPQVQESASPPSSSYVLRESKVPATRISRLWNYGSLAAGMLGGAISESFSRATSMSKEDRGSVYLSSANMERLVSRLSRMRGAALKMGQMMSFQDTKMLPAPIYEVLQRVQDRADYMPSWQRDKVLEANLGSEWRGHFDEFEEKPIAAASIGQVHRATLKSNGRCVAVKIQFPGVADSINSDLDNLGMLLTATSLLPKGLYLDKTIANARTELGWECDYAREGECARRYKALLSDEPDVFVVPGVYAEASGPQVLTMDFMSGKGVTRIAPSLDQEKRDWIGSQILRLCFREITEFRFMQTDPNWTNFLYNQETHQLELLDFGASREYPESFATLYVQLLAAAARGDRDTIAGLSHKLGYLTGLESKLMLDAHVNSVLTLAEPFTDTAPEIYEFKDQTVTGRVKGLIPVMLRERLTPPPEETYSLHRKLSGAFLLCARLGSRVRCRELFNDALAKGPTTDGNG